MCIRDRTKYTMTVGDDLLTYQNDHRYTNEFGRAENVGIELYKDYGEMGVVDLQELPKAPVGINKQPVGLVYKTDYNERKDARERSIYSLQVSYLLSLIHISEPTRQA